jgi:uridine phosphorylase
MDLRGMFGDVEFFLCGGSADRVTAVAEYVSEEFGTTAEPVGTQERYSMIKVGNVLLSSHGMGQPSMSILLHEVTKLLSYAGADDVTYMRLGTCGGLGITPGTVVVSEESLNGLLQNKHMQYVVGKVRRLVATTRLLTVHLRSR